MTRWWNKFLNRELNPSGAKRVKCVLCFDHKGWSGTGNFYKAANVHFEKFHANIKNLISIYGEIDLKTLMALIRAGFNAQVISQVLNSKNERGNATEVQGQPSEGCLSITDVNITDPNHQQETLEVLKYLNQIQTQQLKKLTEQNFNLVQLKQGGENNNNGLVTNNLTSQEFFGLEILSIQNIFLFLVSRDFKSEKVRTFFHPFF